MMWLNSVNTAVVLIRRDPSTSVVWSAKSYWDTYYGIEKSLDPILTFHIAGRREQYEAMWPK